MQVDKWAHVRGLVEFVLPARRPRYEFLAESERGLARLQEHLVHELMRDLDPGLARPVRPQEVRTQLDLHAAPSECYVISTRPAVHDRFLSTVDALHAAAVIGHASILFFLPGRLAFYRSELPSFLRLLVKAGAGATTAPP